MLVFGDKQIQKFYVVFPNVKRSLKIVSHDELPRRIEATAYKSRKIASDISQTIILHPCIDDYIFFPYYQRFVGRNGEQLQFIFFFI